MTNFTFALSKNTCSIPSIKILVKKVKTKKWALQFESQLATHKGRLTTAQVDQRRAICGVLQDGYGVNIGQQIFDCLNDDDLLKIRLNILNY